ncbi:MAG TPA: hypothetical protein VK745_11130 [Polyangiaceae bacterium]|nr:hypothetical protein [Polyangiaceae bacterium]
MRLRRVISILALAAGACSAYRLAPGTPPPEYEPPVIAPWAPPSAADAGVSADAGPASAPPGPELSQDAGVR